MEVRDASQAEAQEARVVAVVQIGESVLVARLAKLNQASVSF
jgi:hypothetical protein